MQNATWLQFIPITPWITKRVIVPPARRVKVLTLKRHVRGRFQRMEYAHSGNKESGLEKPVHEAMICRYNEQFGDSLNDTEKQL
jgi:hypothetical protein